MNNAPTSAIPQAIDTSADGLTAAGFSSNSLIHKELEREYVAPAILIAQIIEETLPCINTAQTALDRAEIRLSVFEGITHLLKLSQEIDRNYHNSKTNTALRAPIVEIAAACITAKNIFESQVLRSYQLDHTTNAIDAEEAQTEASAISDRLTNALQAVIAEITVGNPEGVERLTTMLLPHGTTQYIGAYAMQIITHNLHEVTNLCQSLAPIPANQRAEYIAYFHSVAKETSERLLKAKEIFIEGQEVQSTGTNKRGHIEQHLRATRLALPENSAQLLNAVYAAALNQTALFVEKHLQRVASSIFETP